LRIRYTSPLPSSLAVRVSLRMTQDWTTSPRSRSRSCPERQLCDVHVLTNASFVQVLSLVEGANLIKIHRRSGKLSYLVYPVFDNDPHPALLRSIRVNLRTRQIDSSDYSQSRNPPVLHRKETFLMTDHPLHDKFARLTQQEEMHRLLDDTATIGTREGWQARVTERGFHAARSSTDSMRFGRRR
jgi:DNA phosphorothioation-associated putative methyltransferase